MEHLRLTAIRTCVIVAAVIWSEAVSKSQKAGAKPIDDPEAYAVYASLLPSQWPVSAARAKTLLFQQETATDWECMPTGKPLQTDWKPVVDSFRAENVGIRRVLAGFQLGFSYLVVPAAKIKASFHTVKGDPAGVDRRYPDSGGSFVVVSAVGFDAEKRRAMVYMAWGCGAECGGGTYHLLEKVEGSWRAARLSDVRNCSWRS
jgi:hypothetical protein